MIRNYCKIAWRSLSRNKTSTILNLTSLSVGMAVAMLVGLWIYDELAFNRYYQHYDNIGQVMTNANYDGKIFTINSNPLPLASVLKNDYSNNFKYVVTSTASEQHSIKSGDKRLLSNGRFMDIEAAEMLSLDMVRGNRMEPGLSQGIFLSASLSKKLFGNAEPMGQVLKLDNKIPIKIVGVYADQPGNTEFKDLDFIAPFQLYFSVNEWAKSQTTNWGSQFVQLYVQLNNNASFDKISSIIKNSKLTHLDAEQSKRKPAVFIQPMSKWHLYSKFENGINVRSDELGYVWFYGIIGVFVLVLACINFMNLSTARSEKRAREVGVRKVIGSLRRQLVGQFFVESLLLALLSLGIAISLVQLSLHWFNNISGKAIGIPFTNFYFWLAILLFTCITGILAGTYPAFYLSSFKPIKVLKGSFHVGPMASFPRKVLVVIQFTVCIALSIGTIVVYMQVKHGEDRPIGYSRQQLITMQLTADMPADYNVIRNELIQSGGVSEVAETASPLTSIWSTSSDFDWSGKRPDLKPDFANLAITSSYGKTVGWQFVEGRDFGNGSVDSGGFILNEAAVAQMKLVDPINKVIRHDGKDYHVLGVVKDMVMESPFKPAYPTIFYLGKTGMNAILIKLDANKPVTTSIASVSASFKKLAPSLLFDYQFMDDVYAAKFKSETRIGRLSGAFSALAILISCLGLIGMASFMAEQKVKEIGIRKIVGASVFDLWFFLSRQFVFLVLIALFIAIPLSWYFLHGWLEAYPYRIQLSWWIFSSAAFGAILVTVITVSYQTIRAAIANPVKSLRSE